MTALTTSPTQVLDRPARPWARLVCAAAAGATVAPFAMSQLTGDSGEQITAGLVEGSVVLMGSSIVAVLVAAGLFLAAVRLGQ